jgi:AcrR family transcriptional regulator
MSLRKEKAARLKVQILDQTLKMVGKKPFEDLYVEALCDRVKISKVTFFKYFPQKEDLLLYFFRIWCLDRSIELKARPKEGLQGIYYLAEKMSEECEQRPGIMLSLIGYLSNMKRSLKPFPVKPEEKSLLFEAYADVQQVEILSLDQMIEKFTLEAIFRKEITQTTNTRDITLLFTAVLFGSVLTSHLNQLGALKIYFKRNLDLVVKGLQ